MIIRKLIVGPIMAGLFRDASQFELVQVNPQRVEITVMECPYRATCLRLLETGFTIRDLTCARIGCFRAAPGCATRGERIAEYSWFAGHSWQIASCGRCGVHLGWRFVSDNASFFGLVLARLCERTP